MGAIPSICQKSRGGKLGLRCPFVSDLIQTRVNARVVDDNNQKRKVQTKGSFHFHGTRIFFFGNF